MLILFLVLWPFVRMTTPQLRELVWRVLRPINSFLSLCFFRGFALWCCLLFVLVVAFVCLVVVLSVVFCLLLDTVLYWPPPIVLQIGPQETLVYTFLLRAVLTSKHLNIDLKLVASNDPHPAKNTSSSRDHHQ